MFMIHPKHGATNVSISEVAVMESHGWKVSTHDEWLRMNGKAPEEQKQEPEKRKPGRPPKAK